MKICEKHENKDEEEYCEEFQMNHYKIYGNC